MKDFRGKTAVITGAGSGLGRSFALQLYAAGARLALCDIDMAGLEETRKLTGATGETDEIGDHVSLHRVDVANRAQMMQFASQVLSYHGVVDILINNAGISFTPLTFDEISHEQFEKVININMWGVYNGIRAFLPHLRTRPEASIVNISSLAGLVGLFGYSAYSMSKHAIRGLSEVLQSELGGSNISVLSVHPGGIKTNLIKNAPNLSDDRREAAHTSFNKVALLSADKSARKILRAVQKKRNRLILGADARLVYMIKRLFPGSYPRIIQTIFSQSPFRENNGRKFSE
ncbi:MAG: SDR family NAD(P)-dependent oxidoreductase [Chloroflexi bacterium]|nr:SDR family NAD(P)-dependent oxidoreductase [Chloroflexota bacterium]